MEIPVSQPERDGSFLSGAPKTHQYAKTMPKFPQQTYFFKFQYSISTFPTSSFLICADLYILSIFRYVFNRYGLQTSWLSQVFLHISKCFPQTSIFCLHSFLPLYFFKLILSSDVIESIICGLVVQYSEHLKENIFTLAYLLSLNCKYSWDCLQYFFIPLFHSFIIWVFENQAVKHWLSVILVWSWIIQLAFSHSGDSALPLDGISKSRRQDHVSMLSLKQ